MKKLFLALVCFAGVAFFASCTGNETSKEPTVTNNKELVTNVVRYTHIVQSGTPHYSIPDNEPQKTKTFTINEETAWLTDDEYLFRQYLTINARASCKEWSGMSSDIYTSTNYYKSGSYAKSLSTCVGIVTLVKGKTETYPQTEYVAKAQLDLFYFKSPNNTLNNTLGFLGVGNTSGRSENYILGYIADMYQDLTTGNPTITRNDIVIHELTTNYDTLDNNEVKFNGWNEIIDVTIPEGVHSVKIEQVQSVCWLTAEKNNSTQDMLVGMYGTLIDPANFGMFIQSLNRHGIFASYDSGSDNKGYWELYEDAYNFTTTAYFDIDASSNELLY